jgi:hypothetical protein
MSCVWGITPGLDPTLPPLGVEDSRGRKLSRKLITDLQGTGDCRAGVRTYGRLMAGKVNLKLGLWEGITTKMEQEEESMLAWVQIFPLPLLLVM